MPETKGKESAIGAESTASEFDLRDVAIRMLMGFMFNLLTRQMKKRQSRKKALRRMKKLELKGREVPEELRAAAAKRRFRRGGKPAPVPDEKAKEEPKEKSKKDKAAKRAEKKHKKGRRIIALAVVAAGVIAVRAAKAKKLPDAQF